MALIFNGTTVPTNVANALTYNGTSVTMVVFNSTTVWTQSLFQAKWSGNSQSGGTYFFTISTSGNLLRYVSKNKTGAWITTNLNGTFTGNSLVDSDTMGFITSSNLLRFRFYDLAKGGVDTANWCTFTIANKWTGKSWYNYFYNGGYQYVGHTMETSGGLIRAISGTAGAWLSLT